MMEKWIFFASSWSAVVAIVIYDRGKLRILRRQGERELVRVYRSFRRGLQRDWKPEPQSSQSRLGSREPVEHGLAREAEGLGADGGKSAEIAIATPVVEDEPAEHEVATPADKNQGMRENPGFSGYNHERREETQVVGFIVGAVLGTVAVRSARGWRGSLRRVGTWQSGRR